MTKLLSIREMFKLYELVGQHIPKEPPEDVIQFIKDTIDNIVESGQYSHYTDAILMMHEKTIDDIKDLPVTDIMELFVRGLLDNGIFEFRDFLEKVNFNV